MNPDIYHVRFPNLGWSFTINRVALQFGDFKIYWYGVIIMLGMMLAVLYAYKSAKRYNVDRNKLFNCVFVGLITGIIGARLYFCIFRWDYYSKHLNEIFAIHEGGLAIYGGIIGALLGGLIVAKIQKMKFLPILDVVMVGFLIGQGIGRWGNFFNQECFGTNTTLPWGMTSSTVEAYLKSNCPTLVPTMPVHPTFLYECLADLAIFFILMYIRKHSKIPFETSCAYFALYGTARFFIEGMRTDSLYIGNTGIRTSQLLSLILIIAALLYIAYARANKLQKRGFPKKLYVELTEEKKG